jgi:hypothetical protein
VLVTANVVPSSPIVVTLMMRRYVPSKFRFALVGGGGAFLRGVGSCGGRAARHPEDAVLLCYISFLTSFSFFSVVFCVVFIFDVYVICILYVMFYLCVCFI